ncbi:Small auxin-up RNA [Sesbania bispinosa]|nr:Small auxin-up RNA [Sesbania bispinosa]
MFKSFAGRKIQKGLSHFVHKRPALSYLNEELVEEGTSVVVRDNVKKGYFAVVAMKDGETKKFIVGLNYLTDPAFLGLLDQAREEYGFVHKGALAVPCRPQDLQNILDGLRA